MPPRNPRTKKPRVKSVEPHGTIVIPAVPSNPKTPVWNFLTVDGFLNRLEKYGVSLGLLITFLVWAMPRADKVIDKHIEAVDSLVETQKEQVKTSTQNAITDAKSVEVQKSTGRILEKLCDQCDQIHGGVNEVKGRFRNIPWKNLNPERATSTSKKE